MFNFPWYLELAGGLIIFAIMVTVAEFIIVYYEEKKSK